MKITQQDRDAIIGIMDKVRDDVAERLAAANVSGSISKLVVAEQALRVCLETVLRASLPYDELFLAELATRLAAYCLTAAPFDQHESLAASVGANVPAALRNKVRRGFVIRTEWASG
ncbi:MAG TPA: hypothetical protein VNX86_04510 [Rhizomicrobium sp.]|jgi:hypothetical protein|nr:hypothetical protein [Rhizomicrobium sp.]